MEFPSAGERPLGQSAFALPHPRKQSRSEKRAERIANLEALKPNPITFSNWSVRQSGKRGPLVLQLDT